MKPLPIYTYYIQESLFDDDSNEVQNLLLFFIHFNINAIFSYSLILLTCQKCIFTRFGFFFEMEKKP